MIHYIICIWVYNIIYYIEKIMEIYRIATTHYCEYPSTSQYNGMGNMGKKFFSVALSAVSFPNELQETAPIFDLARKV